MKKVKYYKKNTDRKKHWFSESWGEPLDVVLPNGKVLHFACIAFCLLFDISYRLKI